MSRHERLRKRPFDTLEDNSYFAHSPIFSIQRHLARPLVPASQKFFHLQCRDRSGFPTETMSDYAGHLRRARIRQASLRDALAEHFAERDEFVLEIGCGHGHFLAAYAAAHPEEHCVGFDLVTRRIARAEKKRRDRELNNLAFFKAEVDEFLFGLPAHVRITRIFLLFPDPWPKKRHWKHRLTRYDRLERLAARTSDHGDLFFRTDDHPFFEWTEETIRTHPAWEVVPERPWPFEADTVFQGFAPRHYSLCAIRCPSKPT